MVGAVGGSHEDAMGCETADALGTSRNSVEAERGSVCSRNRLKCLALATAPRGSRSPRLGVPPTGWGPSSPSRANRAATELSWRSCKVEILSQIGRGSETRCTSGCGRFCSGFTLISNFILTHSQCLAGGTLEIADLQTEKPERLFSGQSFSPLTFL
jgi:hypothetical protein